jgi:hypothetical protein
MAEPNAQGQMGLAELNAQGQTISENATGTLNTALNDAVAAASAFINFQETINKVIAELEKQTIINDVNRLKQRVLLLEQNAVLAANRGADNGAFQTPPRKTPNGASISED